METLQVPEMVKPIVGLGVYSVNRRQELVGGAQRRGRLIANEQSG